MAASVANHYPGFAQSLIVPAAPPVPALSAGCPEQVSHAVKGQTRIYRLRSRDDGYFDSFGSLLLDTNPQLVCFALAGWESMVPGLCFSDIMVPQGTQVTSATLVLVLYTNGGSEHGARVHVDTPTGADFRFDSGAYPKNGTPLTSGQAFTFPTVFDTQFVVDVTNELNAVLAHPKWKPGQYVRFFIVPELVDPAKMVLGNLHSADATTESLRPYLQVVF